ncbi:MAG TPA: 3-hydroxyacyl-CoA dehydrogenase family protein, partial [Candidatus Dormibacteraeota bacterium]|nr:3-hydroxyacyl-CoA dehydrogenase family protein [Candidatus Dormibacteraeota bacterium]
MHELKRVLVVGAGTMGSQIALQTALSGRYGVTLVDTVAGQLERARAQNRKLLDRSVEKERVSKGDADHALERIEDSNDLARSASEADLVIEAVIENYDAKKNVFEDIGKHAKAEAILASNSSTIAISRLADASGRPERCCNMHFFHPVTVMQLCEVVRGPKTSDETVETAMEFVRSINRTPVLLQKEIWGFIVNRILFAASEEAMRLYEGGYASAEDIDTAVQKGLNWPMGPFHLLDFSGLDIFYGAMQDRHRLGEGPEPPALLKKLVDEGRLGRKT